MRAKAVYVCSCISLDLDRLGLTQERFEDLMINAEEINKKTFLRNCDIEYQVKENMALYPNDYKFYRYGFIYFYVWSAIENFYKFENTDHKKEGYLNVSDNENKLLSLEGNQIDLNKGVTLIN